MISNNKVDTDKFNKFNKTTYKKNAEEAVVETLGTTNRRVLKSLTIEGTVAENENARTDEPQNAEEAVIEAPVEEEESVYDWVDRVLFSETYKQTKSPTVVETMTEKENTMRDDTKKNTEEAVVETPVEQVDSLFDLVDSVIADYEIRFEAWIPGGEGPVVCIRAIRGDKVSETARVNVANRNSRSMSVAIRSIIIEVVQK